MLAHAYPLLSCGRLSLSPSAFDPRLQEDAFKLLHHLCSVQERDDRCSNIMIL